MLFFFVDVLIRVGYPLRLYSLIINNKIYPKSETVYRRTNVAANQNGLDTEQSVSKLLIYENESKAIEDVYPEYAGWVTSKGVNYSNRYNK